MYGDCSILSRQLLVNEYVGIAAKIHQLLLAGLVSGHDWCLLAVIEVPYSLDTTDSRIMAAEKSTFVKNDCT